jgi:hypothetical protein
MATESPSSERVAESVRKALRLVGPSETAPLIEEESSTEEGSSSR